jgi:hypothetical protein
MLYADKRALEVNLQVALLRIRNKELTFYTDNLLAIGTQASLLAGFAYGGIIMVAWPPDANEFLKGCYLCATTGALSLELAVVGGSMIAAIYGPMLALRGPDGAMHRAVDGMLLEYKVAFILFSTGLGLFLLSSFIFAIVQFHWLLVVPMSGGIIYFSIDLYRYFQFIYSRFGLNNTVTGRFSFDDPHYAARRAERGAAEQSAKATADATQQHQAEHDRRVASEARGGGKAAAAAAAPAAAAASGKGPTLALPRSNPRRMY